MDCFRCEECRLSSPPRNRPEKTAAACSPRLTARTGSPKVPADSALLLRMEDAR